MVQHVVFNYFSVIGEDETFADNIDEDQTARYLCSQDFNIKILPDLHELYFYLPREIGFNPLKYLS